MGDYDYYLRGFTAGQDEANFAPDVPLSIPMLYSTSCFEYLYDPLPEEMSLLRGDSSVLMAILQQPQVASVGAVHPPTMHPNLVSTLRSLVDVDAFNESKISSRAERDSTRTPEEVKMKEDEDIATVPVDLIRNRRPFKCAHGDCNKTFKNPQTRKMHHKTHCSDDPGACRAGAGAEKISGSTGRAGHNKKIPSRCPVCRRTFVGLYELRRHFGRKHSEGEKMHGCRKCGKRFYIEVDLRDHLKLCGEPIQCKCGMKFAFKCNLVAHKKTHPECHEYPSSSSTASAPVLPSMEELREMPGGVKVEDIDCSGDLDFPTF